MNIEYYRIFYLNLILFILFITNQLFLFILIFVIKLPHILNLEFESEYEFDQDTSSFDFLGTKYLEWDYDDEFWYTLIYEEIYILANCKFRFETFGGNAVLDFNDFQDFLIYKQVDNRNYKYIYNKIIYLKNNDSNNITKHYFNQNYNIKYINLNIQKNTKNSKLNINNILYNHELYKNIIKKY